MGRIKHLINSETYWIYQNNILSQGYCNIGKIFVIGDLDFWNEYFNYRDKV